MASSCLRPAPERDQGLRPSQSRPLLLVVRQDAPAGPESWVGDPQAVPERLRLLKQRGEPGHRDGSAASDRCVCRERRFERPPSPGGVDVLRTDGQHS